MAIIDLEVIDIPVGNSIRLLITAGDESSPFANLQRHACLPVEWKARASNRGPGPLRYYSYPDDGGKQSLSLYEGTSYFWKIYSETGHWVDIPLPRLISSIGQGSQCRWSERDLGKEGKEGEFRVLNYLGTAWIGIDGAEFRLFFDLISKKLDFFEEYRSIVEDIALQCNQLLQEFGSPATLRFEVDHERDAITLLERFLFLKSVLSPEKLTRYFDAIRTFSRSRIEKHRKRIPLGYSPGYGFLRDPLKFGLGWRGLKDGSGGQRFLPESIIEEYSNETPDTPPNRFVKYALNLFRQICLDVLDSHGDGKSRGTAVLEAIELKDVLEEVLQDGFWDEVGAMENLPLGNPELQMKVGYREILNIWLLVDLGSRLDWEGWGQVYDGNTRDVPTLYEYWLYFQLFSILREIGFDYVPMSHSMSAGGIPHFIDDKSGKGFTINLKRGYPSVSVFRYRPDPSLRIHFYYCHRHP